MYAGVSLCIYIFLSLTPSHPESIDAFSLVMMTLMVMMIRLGRIELFLRSSENKKKHICAYNYYRLTKWCLESLYERFLLSAVLLRPLPLLVVCVKAYDLVASIHCVSRSIPVPVSVCVCFAAGIAFYSPLLLTCVPSRPLSISCFFFVHFLRKIAYN